MERSPVTSSFIAAVGHDPDTKQMEVEFTNGTVEVHDGVSVDDHAAFVSAKSVGSHWHSNYKGKGKVQPKPDEQAF
jgi:hypothetical protein